MGHIQTQIYQDILFDTLVAPHALRIETQTLHSLQGPSTPHPPPLCTPATKALFPFLRFLPAPEPLHMRLPLLPAPASPRSFHPLDLMSEVPSSGRPYVTPESRSNSMINALKERVSLLQET